MLVGNQGVAAHAQPLRLPALPQVAVELLKLMTDERASIPAVSRVMLTDAGVSAEVLRLANSPLGGRFGAQSVMQALTLLGMARINGLVLTLAMSRFLKGARQNQVLRRTWHHSLASALLARNLADRGFPDADQAYMSGLMHDVGRLALLASQPDIYGLIDLEKSDVRDQEQRLFGVDHCDAGEWVVRNWHLPEYLREVVLRHHDEGLTESTLPGLVRVSCALATNMGFGVLPPDPSQMAVIDYDLRAGIVASIHAIEQQAH